MPTAFVFLAAFFLGACCAYIVCLLRDRTSAHARERAAADLAAAKAGAENETARREAAERAEAEIRAKLDAAAGDVARLRAEKDAAEERLRVQKNDLAALKEQTEKQFELIANRIFTEKSADFRRLSGENLKMMLEPFEKDIKAFRSKMEQAFGDQAKEQFALKSEIERIVRVNKEMTLQAENLANALKGDNKAQGHWGEMMLERILEASDMRKGEDYILQATLKDDNGPVQRPDALIHLPDGKHLIIDAKVSLTAYERFCSEEEDGARALHLKAFLKSLRAHVDGLAGKKYPFHKDVITPDFVFMFMPVEGAYALAAQSDNALLSYAWEKGVVIACPATLFAMLRTTACLWTLERRRQNAADIAERGGRLYDKIAGFAGDMQKLGKHMDIARKSYGDAMNKLSEGSGNMLRQAEMLRDMGVKTEKRLPRELLPADDAAEEAGRQHTG